MIKTGETPKNEEKEYNMPGISAEGYTTNEMYDRINYGRNGGGYGQFASPSANAVRINRNSDVTKLGIDRISDQNEETRRNLGEARVMDNITNGHNRICETEINSEFRNADRLRDIEREMSAISRANAECCCETQKELLRLHALNDKCCCETQKLILEKAASTDALILAVEGRANLDKLAEARAEIAYLRGRGHHH